MKKLFLLSDNMSPIWLLSTVVSTFFVSIWSLIFALQPEKGRHSALIVVSISAFDYSSFTHRKKVNLN